MSGGSSGLVGRLENELRQLWETAGDGGTPIARVCTMNLEVVSPSFDVLQRYTPVVDEVTGSIPARAILASIEPDSDVDELTGTASAVPSAENATKICSERVVLACRGNAAAGAASAIEAFLLPELPTTLVWLGRVHETDPIFEDLANDANRIILDSEYTSIASVIQVASWARRQPNAPQIADLAWTRIATWQEMLARFFDDVKNRELAAKVTKIRIVQASEMGARLGPEAALLLGWVGTRLGWKTARLAGAMRFKRPDGGTIAVELAAVPRPEGVAPHTLASVMIEAGDDAHNPSLKGTIERELASGLAEREGTTVDADVVVWKLQGPDGNAIEQSVRLRANKAAKWLERTLHRPAVDIAFSESVAFAESIIQDGLTVS